MTNYPTYQSPIRTFEVLGISTESIDPNQLKLERKRLLLEIQISDTQTTTIGDKELGKNDVIELFDELEKVTHLDYHTSIYQHPRLLQLLEKSEVSKSKVENKHKIRFETQEEWDEFIAFISPYLAEAIDKLLSKVIRKRSFKELEEIRSFFKLLTKQDSFYAFRKLNNFCETLSDRLEHLAYSKTTFPTEQVTYLSYPAFYTVVNELTGTYPNLPNSVAHAVINFTVDCQRKVGRGKTLVAISDQARKLHCDAKSKSIIIGNRESFYDSREQSLGYNPNQVWRVIVGIFVVVMLLFRVVNRCDSSRSNSPSLSPETLELMERIRENNGNSSSRDDYFDESSFLDLHETVVNAVKNKKFKENYFLVSEDPGIGTPFKVDSIGSLYTLKNETASDMIMVISTNYGLTSHFVESSEEIEFLVGENTSFFFYGGRSWNNSRNIQHLYRSPLNNVFRMVRFNGHYARQNEKEVQFLKKYFSLTDGDAEDFTIKEVDSKYELFQGNRYVNYSY